MSASRDEVVDLRRRVEALEAAVAALAAPAGAASPDPAPDAAPVLPTTQPDGRRTPPGAAAPVPEPRDPQAPGPGAPDDALWALDGLRARVPPGAGAVLLTGTVPLADGGRAVWQQGHPVEAVLDADLEAVARRLQALASEVRLRLLREVLAGRGGSGDLVADPQFGTSGQVQHHLRQLVAAGWLRSTARGRYAVPGERVVPLLVAMAAAGL